jgi:hypothetical protein
MWALGNGSVVVMQISLKLRPGTSINPCKWPSRGIRVSEWYREIRSDRVYHADVIHAQMSQMTPWTLQHRHERKVVNFVIADVCISWLEMRLRQERGRREAGERQGWKQRMPGFNMAASVSGCPRWSQRRQEPRVSEEGPRWSTFPAKAVPAPETAASTP